MFVRFLNHIFTPILLSEFLLCFGSIKDCNYELHRMKRCCHAELKIVFPLCLSDYVTNRHYLAWVIKPCLH